MVDPYGNTEALISDWTLLPQESELVRNKVGTNQLGFAILLKYFQLMARFPDSPQDIPEVAVSYLAQQLKIPKEIYSEYNWQGRSISNHRASIRKLFGFRTATQADGKEMVNWLKVEIIPNEQRIEPITDLVYQRFRELQIEPPTPLRIERLIRSSLHQYETNFCTRIFTSLTSEMREQIDLLLTIALRAMVRTKV